MVLDYDEEAMTPTDESTPESPAAEEEGPGAEVDRTAMSALVREVTATHLIVWTINSSGGLQSQKINVSDVPQQITSAVRILDRNFDQAIQMVITASNSFDNAAQRWDSQVRQSEQKLRANMNAGKLNQVKGQHNQIRTRLGPVKNMFRRVVLMLQEANARYLRQVAGLTNTDLEAEDES
jgi:hypothetical protein